jgi:hypothetical protein
MLPPGYAFRAEVVFGPRELHAVEFGCAAPRRSGTRLEGAGGFRSGFLPESGKFFSAYA